MKKGLLLFMLTLTVGSALIGCGKSSGSSNKDGKIEINVLTRYSSNKSPDEIVMNERINKFMEENPDIKVVHEASGDEATFTNMFKTAVATGDTPDLFINYGGAQLTEYVDSGVLLDLSKVIEEDKAWSDKFIPSMLDAWRYDDIEGVYGIPVASFATGFFYNKDILKKYNLEAPKTIEEFEKVCEKLVENGVIPFALGDKDNYKGSHLLANMIIKRADFNYINNLVNGNVSWTDPVITEILTQMSDWQKKGFFGENITTLEVTAEQSMFLNGQTAFNLNGSWFMSQINKSDIVDKVGFVPFPYYENYEQYKNNWHAGSSEGFSVSGTSSPEEQEATVKLLKYLTDEQAYNAMQKEAKGGVYPISTIVESEGTTELSKEFMSFFENAKEARLEPGDYAASPRLRETIRDSIQGMFAGTNVSDTTNKIQNVKKDDK